MNISGAIFDCDGTLVDSMGMWRDVISWMSERYDVPDIEFARVEMLPLRDTCALFHDELGADLSAEDIYEEVCAHLRDVYEHEVKAMPGVRALLDELVAAGVPLAVASSTPVRELRSALGAHDLLGYFDTLVSTEDVGGRDKDRPDVCLEAARRLGSDLTTTWVFEDAPFGVRTAREAGFAVVGLLHDHDGRREEDFAPADILAHGLPEISLARLRDYERPAPFASSSEPLDVLVVAGSPAPSSPGLVAELARASAYVICADRGADACHAAHVSPDVFCGDEDSVSADAAAWARSSAATTVDFPTEKYATDLAIALDCACHEAARRDAPLSVTLTCASGGRPDHALAVVGQLALAARGGAAARLVEDGYEMRVVSPASVDVWELGPCAVGRTFSAVALEPDTRIDEEGMRWSLADKPLELLGDLGMSNVVTLPDALVRCRAGAVAAFLIA